MGFPVGYEGCNCWTDSLPMPAEQSQGAGALGGRKQTSHRHCGGNRNTRKTCNRSSLLNVRDCCSLRFTAGTGVRPRDDDSQNSYRTACRSRVNKTFLQPSKEVLCARKPALRSHGLGAGLRARRGISRLEAPKFSGESKNPSRCARGMGCRPLTTRLAHLFEDSRHVWAE